MLSHIYCEIYLQGLCARLLQQFYCPASCTFLSTAIMPGEVPSCPSTQLLLEVLWKGPVLHSWPAETETGCRCRDKKVRYNDYICQESQKVAQTAWDVFAKSSLCDLWTKGTVKYSWIPCHWDDLISFKISACTCSVDSEQTLRQWSAESSLCLDNLVCVSWKSAVQ